MGSELTPKFDEEALQRILQRAAQLQADERDVSGSLDGNEVLALGRDVGIPERYLRQAMLEVQAHEAPEPDGWLDEMVGGASVHAERVVRGDPLAIEESLVHYLETEEVFGVIRRTEGQLMLEPVSGWHAAVRRATSGRRLMLQKAESISATIVPLEPGFCQVSLRASLRNLRWGYIGGAAALVSVAVAGTVILGALNAFWPVLLMPLPGAFGFSWAIGKSYRTVAERAQLGLECALDQAERGTVRSSHQLPGRKTGLLDTVISEIETLVTNRTPRSGSSPRNKP